jgi:hypothetical protein
MIETDCIILGKGAPNICKDGSKTMCCIGLSSQYGLIRLYPLSVTQDGDVKVWSKLRIAMEKRSDSRAESYRLVDHQFLGLIDSRDDKSEILNSCCLKSGIEDPITYQNKKQASICVVKPINRIGTLLEPRDVEDSSDADESEFWVRPQCSFPYKPFIKWTSIQGGSHTSHLVGQEVYCGMLNNSQSPHRIFENMRVGDPDYEHWLVLGNMRSRRNVWVVVHLHRLKKTLSTIPLSFTTTDGAKDAWPYLSQEGRNASDVDRQLRLNFTT